VIERRGLLDELRRCDEALEEAVHQCRALEAATASAARELGPSDPVRATRLREAAEVRLTERERDLLTQLIVVRQGRMSIGAVLDSEAALGRALERTRHTMVAALRTAAAARRAAAATRRYGGEPASGGSGDRRNWRRRLPPCARRCDRRVRTKLRWISPSRFV
jgi:hypothetical protein